MLKRGLCFVLARVCVCGWFCVLKPLTLEFGFGSGSFFNSCKFWL